MATKRLRTSTRVQVTVEVNGSSYGPEWVLGKMVEQSNEEALMMLRNKLAAEGLKIVGEPKCLVFSAVEES